MNGNDELLASLRKRVVGQKIKELREMTDDEQIQRYGFVGSPAVIVILENGRFLTAQRDGTGKDGAGYLGCGLTNFPKEK